MATGTRKARLGGNLAVTDAPADAVARIQATRGEALRTVPVGALARSPWQPRTAIARDREDFLALVESVRARGVLEAVLVRELPGGVLELLAGERRLEAARAAGLATVPVRVLPNLADVDAREVALVENLAREDLTAWEEAHGIAALREALEAAGRPHRVRALAHLTGRSIGATSEALQVAAHLTPAVLAAADVQSVNTLPRVALVGAARGETEAERATLQRTYAGAGAPGAAAIAHAKRKRAGKQGARSYTVTGDVGSRFAVTVRRPVESLAKRDGAALLEALMPIVAALRARVR